MAGSSQSSGLDMNVVSLERSVVFFIHLLSILEPSSQDYDKFYLLVYCLSSPLDFPLSSKSTGTMSV